MIIFTGSLKMKLSGKIWHRTIARFLHTRHIRIGTEENAMEDSVIRVKNTMEVNVKCVLGFVQVESQLSSGSRNITKVK